MQERVAYNGFCGIKKRAENRVMNQVFALVFCLIILILFISITFTKNTNNAYLDEKYYYLALESTKYKNKVSYLKQKVKASGGAGVEIKEDGKYHILAYAYKNKQSATKIKQQAQGIFSPMIIEKSLQKIKTGVKRKVKSVLAFSEAYEFIYANANELEYKLSEYFCERQTLPELFLYFQKTKIECEDKLRGVNAFVPIKLYEKQMKQLFAGALCSIQSIYEEMSTEIYKSGDISTSLTAGFVFLIELQANLRENLNKIG